MIRDSSRLLLLDHKKRPCFHHSFYRKNFFLRVRSLPTHGERHEEMPGAACAPGILVALLDGVKIDALGLANEDEADDQRHCGDGNRVP